MKVKFAVCCARSFQSICFNVNCIFSYVVAAFTDVSATTGALPAKDATRQTTKQNTCCSDCNWIFLVLLRRVASRHGARSVEGVFQCKYSQYYVV